MISREELEKMIENGETVYTLDKVWNEIGICNLNENYRIENDRLCGKILFPEMPTAVAICSIPFEDLFANKEDAQWILDKHTTRTETFEPPTWEEMKNKPEHYKEFVFYNKSKSYILYLNDNNEIFLDSMHYGVEEELFYETATKENYEKAVDLAKRLFLGEVEK